MKNKFLKYTIRYIVLFCSWSSAAQISVETDVIKINNPTTNIKNGNPLVMTANGDFAMLVPDQLNTVEEEQAISYFPNYENYGANYSMGIFYKHDQRVYLGGLIRRINGSITNGDTIFILPHAYRPDKRILAKGYQNETPIRINIETSGVVRVLSPSDPNRDWISLEGIHFNRELMIGDFHQGGYVFYFANPPTDLDGDGIADKGLMAASVDQANAVWGCMGTVTSATGTDIGSGKTNTDLILASCSTANIAARLCDELVLDGHDDWFLPSADEMQLIWQNLADSDGDGVNSGPSDPNNLGGISNFLYFSSSEIDQNTAYRVSGTDGALFPTAKGGSLGKLRAIRAF